MKIYILWKGKCFLSCGKTCSTTERIYEYLCIQGLQAWVKYIKQSEEVKENWTGAENFDICLSIIFDC